MFTKVPAENAAADYVIYALSKIISKQSQPFKENSSLEM